MHRFRLGYFAKFALLVALITIGGTSFAMAQTSVSPNYQVSDMEFGAGGTLKSCSSQYCTRASIGSMVSGDSSSSGSRASFGPISAEDEPLLEVIVTDGESNLGVLRTDRPATKTMSVQVRNYLSGGYFMQIVGDSPSYENHQLATPSVPTSSLPGTEQFAINAVENTDPLIGKNPLQVPSEEFSFGYILPNYNQVDKFMYKDGDAVAKSDTESGQTTYTISMIINVSNSTPAGHYSGDFSVVVVPAF